MFKTAIVNSLTLARFPGAYLMYVLYIGLFGQWTVLSVGAALALTDALDGYYARRWGVTTKFGQIVDPFADKALTWAFVLLAFMQNADLIASSAPALQISVYAAVGILALYDVCVISLRIYFWIREWIFGEKHDVPSHSLAKWKTCVLLIGLPLLYVKIGSIDAYLRGTGVLCIAVGLVLTLVILWHYVRDYMWQKRPASLPVGKTETIR